MTPDENQLRHDMAHLCRSLFERGFSVGTEGNVSAVCAAEELEETAKPLVALRGVPTRLLSDDDVADLKSTFGTI
ncbi:hypothetical protein [Antarctobacter jejuensis]|uniref:hypothetical protein n=1 Tax=Antarctobacter jejuensis TaxID=1439938 RepID=UPI003FD3A1C5